MAKELPFFIFEPAQWKFGRIQKRSVAAKVAFIDLLCKYWHNRCELKAEDASLDVGIEEMEELIRYKIVTIEGENIRIKFLDEQMQGIRNTSSKNSEAGKRSAEIRLKKKPIQELEIKTTEIYLIRVGNDLYKTPVSQVLIEKYQTLFESCMMNNLSGYNKEAVLRAMDKEYSVYDFRDQNHLLNALKKIKEKIVSSAPNKNKELK